MGLSPISVVAQPQAEIEKAVDGKEELTGSPVAFLRRNQGVST